MNEEEKAIEFLKNKTTNYSLSGEELHYYLILYYLIINLQKENQQLKEQNEYLRRSIERKESTITELEQEKVPYTNEYVEKLEKAIKETIEYIKTNPLYEEEYDYNYDDELELLGINSNQAEYDLLDILDIKKENR